METIMGLTTLCYIEKDDSYLMLHRVKKENDINQDKWIGVGGHFEENETPEECLLREVKEETGLTLTSYRLRGLVTFLSDCWETEYMWLYTADEYEGTLTECDEGNLEWVNKSEVCNLPIWEGDKIFFRLLLEEAPFFSLKLRYEGDTLVETALDGKPFKEEEPKDKNRLHKQIAFLKEIDKQKQITRQTYLADGSRKEGDAEHAWHLAVMAFLLAEYANENVDVLRVMKMVLVHDMVEIDAGDTYAYDAKANLDKRERELKAADRIFSFLPQEQAEQVRKLWDEFEAGITPEAKFAHTLDNIQPTMLNHASGGKAWREHGVHLEQILKRNAHTKDGSEILWEYSFENFIKPHVEAGDIISSGNIEQSV